MASIKKVLILGVVTLLVTFVNAWQCQDIKTLPIPDDIQEQWIRQCFREFLESGNLEEVAKVGIEVSQKHQKKWMDALQGEIRRLGLLQREIILGESTLQPVIKWGQNISHVFINIKTSHRWDSPPCLNTIKQAVFLNESLLQYVNVCIVSQQKLTFTLRVNLFKTAKVVGQKGDNGNLVDFRVVKNGVGMSSGTFQKLEYEIWPFLNKQASSYAIWPQMAERYASDHQKYEEMNRAIAAKQRKTRTKHQLYVMATISSLMLLLLF